MTYPRRGSSDSVREQVDGQPNAVEDVLEHGDDLQCEYVLATIVADFKDRRLPDIILRDLDLNVVSISEHIALSNGDGPRLPNFEGRHERSLQYNFQSSSFAREYCNVTLA